jgi:lipopolysaccharide biosynthesis regulator YciM
MGEIPPFLLALAFVIVGVAAWIMGRRSGSARTVRLPRDYYVGLDHLINDRIDRAAEVFARMAEQEGDAAEIQFALGSLFRRRGEVERAIAIHSRLREQGASALRDKATFALALDYLSAGLMDRAERLFEELTASREYRHTALDHLVRVYEQQGDWANALKVFHDLPPAVQQERRRVAAHYLCELAEHALLQGDVERTRALIRQARAHDPGSPRAGMLQARVIGQEGDARGALAAYLDALGAAPGLALEIIPRVLPLARQLGERHVIEVLSERLRETGRVSARQLAWLLVTALPPEELRHLPGITAGLSSDITSDAMPGDPTNLGALLIRIGDAGGRYQCDDCGLHSVGWYWRCPKCRSWDSLHPAVFRWAERTEEAVRQGA